MTTPKPPSDALAPCPFCGQSDRLSLDNISDDLPDSFNIECERCHLGQHSIHSRDGAIDAWNTRAALTPAPGDVEALYRGAANEDEAMCQVTSIYNDGWNHCIDHLAAQGHLQTPVPEEERLKDALRDVLKAIVSDRHAVQDTIWVNGSPVGDFIMCALDEEIDLDELQNAPYRCKRTGELPLTAPVTPQSEFCGLKIVCDPSVPDGMILVKDERGKTLLVAGLSANPTTLTYHAGKGDGNATI